MGPRQVPSATEDLAGENECFIEDDGCTVPHLHKGNRSNPRRPTDWMVGPWHSLVLFGVSLRCHKSSSKNSCGPSLLAKPEASGGSIASQQRRLSTSRILILRARAEAVRLCQLSLCMEPIVKVIPI